MTTEEVCEAVIHTLVVDGKVVDRCFVRLSGGKCTASEVNMMSWTKNKHPPTKPQHIHSL